MLAICFRTLLPLFKDLERNNVRVGGHREVRNKAKYKRLGAGRDFMQPSRYGEADLYLLYGVVEKGKTWRSRRRRENMVNRGEGE